MNPRTGESRIRWLMRVARTFRRNGFPTFHEGDRVAIVNPDARAVLGATGTVKEVIYPFAGWEYHVLGDDPNGEVPTAYPEEGALLATQQIKPISVKETDQ